MSTLLNKNVTVLNIVIHANDDYDVHGMHVISHITTSIT